LASETTTYDSVRSHPFTRIHGRPSQGDYETLKQEASILASEDVSYAWSQDTVTNDEYGLLAEIIGSAEYEHQTGIDIYIEETEPATYDPTITDLTSTHPRKRLDEEWERTRTYWYIRKGFL
jgi:hypothetical protein